MKHRQATKFGKGSRNTASYGTLETRTISATNEDFLKTNRELTAVLFEGRE